MSSENAKNAAKEVIKRIEKGEKVVMGEILESIGYAKNTADNPILVTETKTFKETIAPFLEQLEERRQATISKLTDKKLDKASALQTASVLDILTKNLQLLRGDPTEITKNKEFEGLAQEIKNLIEEVKK